MAMPMRNNPQSLGVDNVTGRIVSVSKTLGNVSTNDIDASVGRAFVNSELSVLG